VVGAASQGGRDSRKAAPQLAAAYLTGDRNVVLLTATLIYRINDPITYALEESHVGPALDRLFRATTVRITAGKNLNDFLVVQTNANQSQNSRSLSAVRESLLRAMNDRLHALEAAGAGLGVEIGQINLTPSLPPAAKAAFDRVIVAAQAADRGVAVASTDAERQRQQANRQAEQIVSAAQATAAEIVSKASVDTASILALVHGERAVESRDSLLLREYRARVANIMATGRVTLVDPKSGARVLLPGKQ
jgi:regulator of protease activity HflC (stomatin/prohibitin superfamily)